MSSKIFTYTPEFIREAYEGTFGIGSLVVIRGYGPTDESEDTVRLGRVLRFGGRTVPVLWNRSPRGNGDGTIYPGQEVRGVYDGADIEVSTSIFPPNGKEKECLLLDLVREGNHGMQPWELHDLFGEIMGFVGAGKIVAQWSSSHHSGESWMGVLSLNGGRFAILAKREEEDLVSIEASDSDDGEDVPDIITEQVLGVTENLQGVEISPSVKRGNSYTGELSPPTPADMLLVRKVLPHCEEYQPYED